MHPIAPVVTLSAVVVWPILAAFLLFITPANRQAASSLTFAIAGVVMTPIAMWIIPEGDAMAALCACIVTTMPLFLPIAQDRAGRILPFLVTGCVLMALNIHSAFAIIIFCGAGTVLLAWREGHRSQKAAFVWDMARSRLGGVMLGVLGASLLSYQSSPIGPVFLTVGLCMMAGLGPSPIPDAEASLLDTGLRFASLLLMLRLNTQHPLVHILVLVAGFGTLAMGVLRGRQGSRKTFLPMLTALGAIAAGVNEGGALVLLLLVCLALSVLELRAPQGHYSVIALGMAPWPVFCALVAIGRSLDIFLLSFMIICILPELKDAHFIHLFKYQKNERISWAPLIENILLVVGLFSPIILVWHPVSGWKP